MVDEIVEAMDRIEADADVGAVVVTGAPPAFCAGADLSHLGGSQRDGLRSVYEGFMRIARSTAADDRGGERRRGRRGDEPRAGRRRSPCRAVAPGSTPASSSSGCIPAAATRGCSAASPDRRRWPRPCCSARSSTAPKRSASGSSGAASTTTRCCPRPASSPAAPRPHRASS